MSQRQVVKSQSGKSTGTVSCDTSTQSKSTSFIKQMLALSLSNIVYLRGIFDEDAFKLGHIGDVPFKILKTSKTDKNVNLVIKWLRGMMQALEKKYLRQATLTINLQDEPQENPLESYSFDVVYHENNSTALSASRNGVVVSEKFTENNIRDASLEVLKDLCEVCEHLDVLPDDVVLNMELSYYDDRTPADYEPPGFRPAPSKRKKPSSLEVGSFDTQFHSIRLRINNRTIEDENSIAPMAETIGATPPAIKDATAALSSTSLTNKSVSSVDAMPTLPATASSRPPAAVPMEVGNSNPPMVPPNPVSSNPTDNGGDTPGGRGGGRDCRKRKPIHGEVSTANEIHVSTKQAKKRRRQ